MTKQNEIIDKIFERFDERFPCINSSCNNNGTLAVGNYGTEPEPEQCQYCYQERFPFKSFLRTELEALVLGEDEIKFLLIKLYPYSYTDDGECQLKGFIIDGNKIAKAITDYQTRRQNEQKNNYK